MMGPDMETLSSFVVAAQHGDLEAFGCIVGRFQAMARAMSYAMVDDSQLAEDVAQEAFVEAFLSLPKLREPAAFPGWFRRIVFKQGDRLIRGKHVMTMPLESVGDVPLADLDPALVIEGREMDDVVRHAVEVLPEHERIVVILFYGTGYALKEIAAFLEVPVTTVKKRLHDARQRLRGELIEEGKLSEEDQQVIRRARKVQQFLTQPFFVAEQFTGLKGQLVSIEDTIKGFKEIIEGKHDDLPEQAFYMVGTIEEAVEAGKQYQE